MNTPNIPIEDGLIGTLFTPYRSLSFRLSKITRLEHSIQNIDIMLFAAAEQLNFDVQHDYQKSIMVQPRDMPMEHLGAPCALSSVKFES